MNSMIQDLLNPSSLPDPTGEVSLVQTHISQVLVADEFVYKIKKPVNFGFLDFTTLDKREYYCRQEVMLNRRLAEDIYLDVLPVTSEGGSHTLRGSDGEVVEYAVRMRRIPEDRLMKSLFERGELGSGHLKEIARVLAGFHARAEQSPEIDRFGLPEAFKINTDENFEQTRNYIQRTIEKLTFEALREWTEAFYRKKAPLFLDRIGRKKIRDCHGDLHMEHICLTDPLSIIDCIEFNERFRYSDTIADIAFLLMDLDYCEGAEFSQQLWKFYGDETGDSGMDDLLAFYKVYRAYVRGKVISFQLDDPLIGSLEKERAAQSASRYFQLALSYIE